MARDGSLRGCTYQSSDRTQFGHFHTVSIIHVPRDNVIGEDFVVMHWCIYWVAGECDLGCIIPPFPYTDQGRYSLHTKGGGCRSISRPNCIEWYRICYWEMVLYQFFSGGEGRQGSVGVQNTVDLGAQYNKKLQHFQKCLFPEAFSKHKSLNYPERTSLECIYV